MPSSLCLNMIVKNEAHVIRRCLDSVRPFVSSWVIVDTGSSDGTQDIVRGHLADVPGTLHEQPWRDFGTNRSEALALARERADYVLVMDADHELRAPVGFRFGTLVEDGYYIRHRYAGIEYGLPILLATRIPWRYQGVLHEYVTADVPHRFVALDGPWVDVHHEGARSRDPQTYLNDAKVLREALHKDPANARYAYYLAQTLKDAGLLDQAFDAFMRRAAMPGFDEETWHARYQAAQIAERLGRDAAIVADAYLQAYNARPRRAEPLVQLARFHRERQQWALAYLYARAASAMPRPADHLFVEEAAYAWRADDELSIAAWYVGAHDEGRRAAERLLESARFPASERARIERNAAYYRDAPPR